MASINYAAREINVKIVYYGPGLSGKTTNLQVIHRKVPPEFKSDMVSLATETDRTLFFDFLPLDLGKIKGFSTKFQLYTVPGQVYYNATRKLVLRGVDGIVFVADSGSDKIEENLESFQNLEENLAEYGYKRETIPTIIQYNKRDLPNALSVEEMHQHINKYNLPWSEAVANKGAGVFDSLKLIGKIVIDYLNNKYSRGGTGQRPAPKRPMPPPPPPPRPQQPPMPQQGYQPSQQFAAPNRVPPPPPRAPQSPSMYNQLGGQQPHPMQQRPPVQNMQMPMSAPSMQPPRQPIVPPRQMPPATGRAPVHPTLQQQSGYQPQQAPAAQQNYQQRPPQVQRQPAPHHDEITFEPPSQGSEPPPATQDFYNYGSIDLEPMNQQSMSAPPAQQPYDAGGNVPQHAPSAAGDDFNISGKTDLDLEIERYQREIEEKQRRSRGMPGAQPPQQQEVQPQSFEPPPASHEDYEVYNMSAPSYEAAPPQQPVQQNILGSDDEEMFFTSVDRDRQKKPVKRPMNPRATQQPPQQDKGFLSKFFKKDMP